MINGLCQIVLIPEIGDPRGREGDVVQRHDPIVLELAVEWGAAWPRGRVEALAARSNQAAIRRNRIILVPQYAGKAPALAHSIWPSHGRTEDSGPDDGFMRETFPVFEHDCDKRILIGPDHRTGPGSHQHRAVLAILDDGAILPQHVGNPEPCAVV